MIIIRLHVEEMEPGWLSRPEKLSMLRGQLSILRRQREEELPITVESLAKAERVARSLELEEVIG